jgi:hypothetical protein
MKATLTKNAAPTTPTVIKNVLPAELLAMACAMGELATEDVEASWAFRFAVHFFAAEEMLTESLVARVMAWMAEKRTADRSPHPRRGRADHGSHLVAVRPTW